MKTDRAAGRWLPANEQGIYIRLGGPAYCPDARTAAHRTRTETGCLSLWTNSRPTSDSVNVAIGHSGLARRLLERAIN